MGQIVGGSAKTKRCNIRQLSQLGTPAAGEYILVSSDNSMNAVGQGNFDCYIVGDGTTATTALTLHKFKAEELDEQLNGIPDVTQTFTLSMTAGQYILPASSAKKCTMETGKTYTFTVVNASDLDSSVLNVYFRNSDNTQDAYAYLNGGSSSVKTFQFKKTSNTSVTIVPTSDIGYVRFYVTDKNATVTLDVQFSVLWESGNYGLIPTLATKSELESYAKTAEVSAADATIIEQVEQSVKKVISDSVTIEEYLNGNLEENIINADGSTVTSSSMRHVAISNLTEGLVLTLRNYYIRSNGSKAYSGSATSICAVCAKNGDTIVPSKGRTYNANLSQYVVPADIDNVILTIRNESNYTHREILRTEVDAITTYYKQQILDGAPLQWSGSLNAGEIKYLPVENVSLGKIFVFTAHVSTFGALTFGRLNSAGDGLITPKVEVNETSVVCYSNTSSSFNTSFEHGLTIANDIQVIVQVGEEVKIVVQSNGSRWQTTTTRSRNGEYANSLAVTTDTGTFTDCVLSVSLQNLRKDTWVFGDSWVSLYEQRWTYQAIHLGYSNWFLNGFAGATSQQGFDAFQTLVGVHIPKTLLWLYGMNDIDTDDSTPNSDWLSVVEQVEDICKKNNIELILATIPTTPTRNMNAKNAYVRASGHRYVDQAAAMGADTSGNWFSGYSSEDGNHTTTQGAIALMGRFFCDVPELMYNE